MRQTEIFRKEPNEVHIRLLNLLLVRRDDEVRLTEDLCDSSHLLVSIKENVLANI